jgi:hypothetical protein
MANFFTALLEQSIERDGMSSPSVSTGYAVDTAGVISHELSKNPYYLSINNMSAQEGAALLASDRIKTGTSMVSKLPSVSKSEYVHINPLPSNGIVGGPTGKLSDLSSIGTLHCTNASTKFHSPTIIGYQSYAPPAVPSNYSATTIKDNSINVNNPNFSGSTNPVNPIVINPKFQGPFLPNPSQVPPGVDPKFQGPFDIVNEYQIQPITDGSHMLPDLDPKTGKKVETKETGKAPTGENIRTGTYNLGIMGLFDVITHGSSLFNF